MRICVQQVMLLLDELQKVVHRQVARRLVIVGTKLACGSEEDMREG